MYFFDSLKGKKSTKICKNFISDRQITNQSAIYTGTYTFSYPKGFVKICVGKPGDNVDPFTLFDEATNIKINRVITKNNTFKIDAQLDKKLFKIVDKKTQQQWLPWIDDAEYIDNTENKYIRGGNRLELMLQYPGEYTITIPDDVDLILEIQTGNIAYFGGTGEISVTANDVSRCGTNGSFVNGVHQWEYIGDKKSGYSVLITHNGRVDL